MADSQAYRVYVGNIDWKISWQDLKDHMKSAGEVAFADIIEEYPGRSKGAGIVEFKIPEGAQNAIATLSDSKLGERWIFVREDRGSSRTGRRPRSSSPTCHGGRAERWRDEGEEAVPGDRPRAATARPSTPPRRPKTHSGPIGARPRGPRGPGKPPGAGETYAETLGREPIGARRGNSKGKGSTRPTQAGRSWWTGSRPCRGLTLRLRNPGRHIATRTIKGFWTRTAT